MAQSVREGMLFLRRHARPHLAAGMLGALLVSGACTNSSGQSTGAESAGDASQSVPQSASGGDSTQPGDASESDSGRLELDLVSDPLAVEDTCDALLSRLIDEALSEVDSRGLPDNSHIGGGNRAFEEIDPDGGTSRATAKEHTRLSNGVSSSTGMSFSSVLDDSQQPNLGANSKVAVQQPDIVKTDGRRLAVLTDAALQVLDITGTDPMPIHNIDLGAISLDREMFLIGDRAIVISNIWQESAGRDGVSAWRGGEWVSQIVEVDLDSGSVGEEFAVQGTFLSARAIDDSIRIAFSSPIGRLPFASFRNESTKDLTTDLNKGLVENSTIDDWIPRYTDKSGATHQLVPCSQMYVPSEVSEFRVLSIVTLNLSEHFDIEHSVGVVGDGDVSFPSATQVVLTSVDSSNESTQVHTFDISDPFETTHLASGSFDGGANGRYWVSEHNGYLCIAFTRSDTSSTEIVVLRQNESGLEEVGRLSGLGVGQHLLSVQFIGDVAILASSVGTAPIYTIDLSDPTNPTVLGQLDVSGYLGHLQPTGDTQVIGIGREGNERWQLLGTQLSVFDIEDPTNQTVNDSLSFGLANYSSVELYPRSFTWWAPSRTAFIPVSKQDFKPEIRATRDFSSTVVLEISIEGDITELGRISHPADSYCGEELVPIEEFTTKDVDPATTFLFAGCHFAFPQIRRTLVIGDTVYTVSNRGVQANALDGLAATGWVEFEQRP